MRNVVILLPCRNSGIYLIDTLQSILNSTKYPNYKIYLLDGDSTDGTSQVCDMFANRYPDKIKVFHLPKLGVTKTINYGIKQTKDEDILLTQDDTIFYNSYQRDWLQILVEGVDAHENVGIITYDSGWGKSGPNYLDGFVWVGTWCMYIPRETINEIGILDEAFNPGDGDDIDYSYRIFKAKKNFIIANIIVEHHRKFNVSNHEYESQEIKEKNGRYFREKWNIK